MAAVRRRPSIRLASALRENLRRFRGLAQQTVRDPTPDRVHDLRVVTRRIRAGFWLIPTAHRTRAIRRSRRELQRLASTLGQQRKYDVALDDATRYRCPARAIAQRRHIARRRVVRALRDKDQRRYARHLERAIEDVPARTWLFASRISELARRLHVAMRHPPRTDAARHLLRIRVKKARYLLEAARRPAARLERLQDHLGRWHDLTVLSGLTRRGKPVVAARAREWRLAERCLRPALRQATHELSGLIAARDER